MPATDLPAPVAPLAPDDLEARLPAEAEPPEESDVALTLDETDEEVEATLAALRARPGPDSRDPEPALVLAPDAAPRAPAAEEEPEDEAAAWPRPCP